MSLILEEVSSFEELGGIFLDIHQKFEHANFEKPLKAFVPSLEQTHQQHFEGRISPSGSVWPALSPVTIKRKGHSVPLVDTGRLKASVLQSEHPDHVGGVTHRGLLFGTSVEYGIFHQDGTARIPQREFVGMNDDTTQKIVDASADHTVEGLKLTLRG